MFSTISAKFSDTLYLFDWIWWKWKRNSAEIKPGRRSFWPETILLWIKDQGTSVWSICYDPLWAQTGIDEIRPGKSAGTGTSGKMLNYLNMHFTEVISLQDLADQVHLSREVCCRLFKKWQAKLSPDIWKNTVSTKAFHWCRVDSILWHRITEMVGFSIQAVLPVHFVKRFGCNPGEYNSVKHW